MRTDGRIYKIVTHPWCSSRAGRRFRVTNHSPRGEGGSLFSEQFSIICITLENRVRLSLGLVALGGGRRVLLADSLPFEFKGNSAEVVFDVTPFSISAMESKIPLH